MEKAGTQDTKTIHERIISAMLSLAAKEAWQSISLSDIVEQSGLSMSDVIGFYDDKTDVLAAYDRQINKRLADEMGGQSLEGDSDKDKLFDILMERFEILNEHRAANLSILNAITLDPKQIILTMPWVCKAMALVLEMANVPSHGWQGAIRITGMTAVYLKTLRIWIGDENADLSATMAALDKNLEYAFKAGRMIKI